MIYGATIHHKKVLQQTMNYVLHALMRGLVLAPKTHISDPKTRSFIIKGRSHSNYAMNPETRKSTSGIEVTLNGAPVATMNVGQKIVALSATEDELIARTQEAQGMLHVMMLLESMELHVENPMILECDNKGAIYITNNLKVNGRTKHIDTR